jgi:drug/metabolite transporter (DMT)-like permease
MTILRAADRPTRSSRAGSAPAAVRSPRAGRPAGIAIGLASALFFGTSGTFGSALIGAGWSPGGAVLARVTVAALALTIPALITLRGRWSLLRRSAGRVIMYGLVGVAACQVAYFNAIALMPVGIALLLEYMGVVLIVGWLWLRHGQRPWAGWR